jgi:hypothetical protein
MLAILVPIFHLKQRLTVLGGELCCNRARPKHIAVK